MDSLGESLQVQQVQGTGKGSKPTFGASDEAKNDFYTLINGSLIFGGGDVIILVNK